MFSFQGSGFRARGPGHRIRRPGSTSGSLREHQQRTTNNCALLADTWMPGSLFRVQGSRLRVQFSGFRIPRRRPFAETNKQPPTTAVCRAGGLMKSDNSR